MNNKNKQSAYFKPISGQGSIDFWLSANPQDLTIVCSKRKYLLKVKNISFDSSRANHLSDLSSTWEPILSPQQQLQQSLHPAVQKGIQFQEGQTVNIQISSIYANLLYNDMGPSRASKDDPSRVSKDDPAKKRGHEQGFPRVLLFFTKHFNQTYTLNSYIMDTHQS